MDVLEQLRTAVVALPSGTLITVSREALLEVLGGLESEGRAPSGSDVGSTVAVDLTVRELAQRFGRSPSTIRQWIESGQLEGYKLLGREWRVPRAAVATFQERQRLGPDGPGDSGGGTPSLSDWRKIT